MYPTKNAYSSIYLNTCGIHVGYMWDTTGYSRIQQDTVVESCIQAYSRHNASSLCAGACP